MTIGGLFSYVFFASTKYKKNAIQRICLMLMISVQCWWVHYCLELDNYSEIDKKKVTL